MTGSLSGTIAALLGCAAIVLLCFKYAGEAQRKWVFVFWLFAAFAWALNAYDFALGEWLVVDRAEAASICKPEDGE